MEKTEPKKTNHIRCTNGLNAGDVRVGKTVVPLYLVTDTHSGIQAGTAIVYMYNNYACCKFYLDGAPVNDEEVVVTAELELKNAVEPLGIYYEIIGIKVRKI